MTQTDPNFHRTVIPVRFRLIWDFSFLFFSFVLAPGKSDSCLVDMFKFCIRGLFFMLSYHRKVLPGSFCTDLGLFTFWPLTVYIMYDPFLPFLDMFRFCILWLFFHAKLSYNQSSQCVSGRFGTFFLFFPTKNKCSVFCITFFSTLGHVVILYSISLFHPKLLLNSHPVAFRADLRLFIFLASEFLDMLRSLKSHPCNIWADLRCYQTDPQKKNMTFFPNSNLP